MNNDIIERMGNVSKSTEIKLPSKWKSMSPIDVINESGYIPCVSCGEVIYRVKEGKKFFKGDTISANDFESIGDYPNPIPLTPIICPKCKKSLMCIDHG